MNENLLKVFFFIVVFIVLLFQSFFTSAAPCTSAVFQTNTLTGMHQ